MLKMFKLLSLLFWLAISIVSSNLFASSILNIEWLQKSDRVTEFVATSEFKPPHEAKSRVKQLAAKLTLSAIPETEKFNLLVNEFGHSIPKEWLVTQLPKMQFQIVIDNGIVFSDRVAIQSSEHPYWEWQISNGKVWQEDVKTGLIKAVLPFSVLEKNANCTHNGLLTFYISQKQNTGQAQEISNGYFQIASETCAYFQFDLAGRVKTEIQHLDMTEQPAWLTRAKNVARTKVKNLSDLKADYPKLNIDKITKLSQHGSTTSGLIIEGTHYRIDCQTRYGEHPLCEQVALPSYSTAKSLFAGLALMHLEKRVPNISLIKVTKYLPECNPEQWKDVTLADLINMRTGNYLNRKPHLDESSKRMIEFLTTPSHADKIRLACEMFPKRAQPGKYFVYHSSDTYLAGVMMERLFRKLAELSNIYSNMMVKSLWRQLALSPLLDESKRTEDKQQQAFTGWGLTYTIDDLIQLVDFIHQQADANDSMLAEALYASALQTKGKIGDKIDNKLNQINLPTETPGISYNFGFWGLNVQQSLDCESAHWIPFMSGYGGITVALISPQVTYYNFSDNNRHVWLPVVTEINKHFALCEG